MISPTRLLNFAVFYIGWITCVVGAARGYPWLGPAVVAVAVTLHLRMAASPMVDLRVIAITGAVGFLVEALFASAGLYTYVDPYAAQWLCPPWMVALWIMFATTLREARNWLAHRPAVAALLGALAGPLSYIAGARLGAITLHQNLIFSLVSLALAWAAVMPALLWLQAQSESPLDPMGGRTSV